MFTEECVNMVNNNMGLVVKDDWICYFTPWGNNFIGVIRDGAHHVVKRGVKNAK